MQQATIRIRFSAVMQLVGINIALFILQWLVPALNEFALNSATWLQQPWTLFTAMFLHNGFAHLFFNLYALFIFGPLVEYKIGRQRFLWLYFGSGLLASLAFVIYREVFLGVSGSAVGASGAIMGVLGMVIMLFPKMKVLFFFIVPMSMRTAGIIFALIDLFGAFNPTSSIAHVAHLAGLAVGLLYGWYLLKQGKEFRQKFTSRTFTGARPTVKAKTRSGQTQYEDTIELTKDDIDEYYKSGRL